MEINQDQLAGAQKQLRGLINMGLEFRDYCCATSQCDARDDIIKAVGHLMLAEAAVGQLKFFGPDAKMIATRDGADPLSGDK